MSALRTPPLAEVNVNKLVSTAAAVRSAAAAFLGPERAADVLDAADRELLLALPLVVPRGRAGVGAGVLAAPRDGAPRGRKTACARGHACGGRTAAAAAATTAAVEASAAGGCRRGGGGAPALGTMRRPAPLAGLV